MKKIDIKSFLIGVLITTNLFLIMGFKSNTKPSQLGSVLYGTDDLYVKLVSIDDKVHATRYSDDNIYFDLQRLSDLLDMETDTFRDNSIKNYLKKIYDEVRYK